VADDSIGKSGSFLARGDKPEDMKSIALQKNPIGAGTIVGFAEYKRQMPACGPV
jgi:hypothetical protein